MAKFPEPPGIETLRAIPPSTSVLVRGTRLARIHFAGGPFPSEWNRFRYYGPTASRFDPHVPDASGQAWPQERGVMYAACGDEAVPTCLAEVFQAQRVIDTRENRPVLSVFDILEPLELLDLSGPFVTAIGASTAIHSGSRPRARRWARQFYEAYPSIDGLLYCSLMYGNAPVLALFERAANKLPLRPIVHRLLGDPLLRAVLVETSAHIGYRRV